MSIMQKYMFISSFIYGFFFFAISIESMWRFILDSFKSLMNILSCLAKYISGIYERECVHTKTNA